MSQRKQLKRKNQLKTKLDQKSNTFEYGIFNLSIPEHIEEPQDLSKVRTDYIPFGTNNLFPQYLAELKRKEISKFIGASHADAIVGEICRHADSAKVTTANFGVGWASIFKFM